jgi:hypothetical protein
MQNGRSLVVSRNSFNCIRCLVVLLECASAVEKKECLLKVREGAVSSVCRSGGHAHFHPQKKRRRIFVVLFIRSSRSFCFARCCDASSWSPAVRGTFLRESCVGCTIFSGRAASSFSFDRALNRNVPQCCWFVIQNNDNNKIIKIDSNRTQLSPLYTCPQVVNMCHRI